MSHERTMSAVSRLSAVALDYPELSEGIAGLISDLLVQSPREKPKLVDEFAFRSNGATADHKADGGAEPKKRPRSSWVHPGEPVRRPEEVTATGRPQFWYTAAEVAMIFGRSEWTVGQWCREGKVKAVRFENGPGPSKPWRISADEVERLTQQGFRLGFHCRNSEK